MWKVRKSMRCLILNTHCFSIWESWLNYPKTPCCFISCLLEGGREGARRNKHPADTLHESASLWDVTIINTCRRLACERKATQSHIGEQKVFQNMLRQWDKRDLPLPPRRSFTERQSSDLVRVRCLFTPNSLLWPEQAVCLSPGWFLHLMKQEASSALLPKLWRLQTADFEDTQLSFVVLY